jgi:hypothetical protein
VRFVVDMNLSPEWVALLANEGHDILHWRDIGLESAGDDEIMDWAAHEQRVVLTAWFRGRSRNPGIIRSVGRTASDGQHRSE